ncbi:hypothetical protein BLNAU_1082 [Blattamonas nauphoetae]|uniref:Uncharacterized protein n=1 Tax=Blattamonas nauphoetae TaxID=2049346 RepID=A0ABQ9YJR3_9EUKA|nr:hypothetical protein BLNAU_1082 [Blattamonas nauphoetae]
MTTSDTIMDSSLEKTCSDCSPFLHWNEDHFESEHEKTVVFRSLVATLQFQPVLDEYLEAKAAKCLEYVVKGDSYSVDSFLSSLGSFSGESLMDFVHSVVMLISSPSNVITTASMKMLGTLIEWCSAKPQLALIKVDLIPQIIATLNPLSLFFAEALDIHNCLIRVISSSFWLLSSNGLSQLKIENYVEEQAVHETVLKQVLFPSENYIWHLCANRFSVVDGEQSKYFLALLAGILEKSPYYQPMMDIVLPMPIILTIPSCLTFFEADSSIYTYIFFVVDTQREWSIKSRDIRRSGTAIFRCLRMEGIEDVFDEKLRNDKKSDVGQFILDQLLKLINLQGMNLPEPE